MALAWHTVSARGRTVVIPECSAAQRQRQSSVTARYSQLKAHIRMSDNAMSTAMEIIGWIGSFGILLAYGLNSYQKIRSDSRTFLLLNLAGGLLLVVYTFYKDAFANTFLNIVWVIIAVVALMKLSYGNAAKKPQS